MNHEEEVKKILSATTALGYLKSRESSTVEFKEAFDVANTAKYGKTMAAFANNRGGYILFGIKDNPREIVGLKNNKFETMSLEKFTDAINNLFAPSIEWQTGIVTVRIKNNSVSSTTQGQEYIDKNIGWIYVEEAENKPVVALKQNSNEKISSGDIFYRYRARSEKIKFAEISKILNESIAKERNQLLKLFNLISKAGTANLGIVNYSDGKLSTPYGVDVSIERKFVTQVLRKAKFIKEGSFNEIEGKPVIKVTGNIDLAEEVAVPELDPDISHPYIQKDMFEKLDIPRQDLYALIWYFKMKESKRYHLEVTTSRRGKSHKFSEFALRFLEEKLQELKTNPQEFERIRTAFRNRNKSQQP